MTRPTHPLSVVFLFAAVTMFASAGGKIDPSADWGSLAFMWSHRWWIFGIAAVIAVIAHILIERRRICPACGARGFTRVVWHGGDSDRPDDPWYGVRHCVSCGIRQVECERGVERLAPEDGHYNAGRYARREDPPTCRACGYDLRATPEKCPECGAVPSLAAERRACTAAAAQRHHVMRLSPDHQSAADGRAEDAALASTAVHRGSERRGWRAVWLAFGTWLLYPGIALVRDFGYRPGPWILAPLFVAALGVAVVGVGLSVLCLCDKSGRRLGILGLVLNGLTVLINCLLLWEELATLARIPAA